MTALVFGASAGVGRALARQLAALHHNLFLISRDARDLEAEAAHLRNVYGVSVGWMAINASHPETIKQLREAEGLSSVRHLLFPIGMAIPSDDGLLPSTVASDVINANLTSVIATISIFLPRLLKENGGNVVGVGSIAAIRGRGSNVVYAAAKRGLESYFESLRHKTESSSVRIQFYRVGYIDSQMSYGKRTVLPKTSPEKVAATIVRNLGKDIGCMTLPSFWRPVGYLVKILPWWMYRKLSF